MLVLQRSIGEMIYIGEDIHVKLIRVSERDDCADILVTIPNKTIVWNNQEYSLVIPFNIGVGHSARITDDVSVTVTRIRESRTGYASLGIAAPLDIKIWRHEIYNTLQGILTNHGDTNGSITARQ